MAKNNMVKTIFFILILATIALVAMGVLRFSQNQTSVFPYPYIVEAPPQDEIKLAQQADILILGASSAGNLKRFTPEFVAQTKTYLKKPLTIYNWSSTGETMAQTLRKLKSLKKPPTLTIYHGGGDELWTKRFHLSQGPKIVRNINLSRDDSKMSMMLTFPLLSRLFYEPIQYVNIGLIPKEHDSSELSDLKIQQILKLHYSLYRQELADFFKYFKEKDAKVWVVTQALNIEKPPLKSCDGHKYVQHIPKREAIRKLLKENKYKEANRAALALTSQTLSHADDYYLLGQSYLKSGRFSAAKRAFYQALMFDCSLKTGTPIHLKMLMEEAEKRKYLVIDFNRLVTDELGRNKLFFDETTPQDIYYEKLIELLVEEFKKFLKG